MNNLLRSNSLYLVTHRVLLPSIYTPSSVTNPVCLQCVRWRKKPRWLPIAKTKLFKIPKRKDYPSDEKAEIIHRLNDYKTRMKAIRIYLSEKTKSLTTAPEVIAEQQRLLEEDNTRCFELNDKWNKEVAAIREKRSADEAERKRLEVLNEVEEFKRKEAEELELINRMVRLEMENSKSFITSENIDVAIEKALNETVDYNYCIDLDGNIYRGLRARPGVSEPENKGDGGGNKPSSLKQAVNQ